MNLYLPLLFVILCGFCLTSPFEHTHVNACVIDTERLLRGHINRFFMSHGKTVKESISTGSNGELLKVETLSYPSISLWRIRYAPISNQAISLLLAKPRLRH